MTVTDQTRIDRDLTRILKALRQAERDGDIRLALECRDTIDTLLDRRWFLDLIET